MSPDEISKTLEAFVDVLIPGDADFPSASAAGAHGLVAERIRAAEGSAGIVALAEALTAGDSFLTADRVAATAAFAAADPTRFVFARFATYLAYYQTPAVILTLQRIGHDYNDAPQPRGYRMAPFDPALHTPKNPGGAYKKTEEIVRLDVSTLADLNLPGKG